MDRSSVVFSPLAFPADPFPYIRWAVQKLYAVGLTYGKKLHYTQIHERDFLKIQCKLFSVALDLLLQLIEVLALKAADQADGFLAVQSMLFNFQG